MNYEVYDLETLSNLFTYTGYDCLTKEWHQFVISNWRNDLNELYDWLKYQRINKYYQVGYNNENFDYPIIHHIFNHYDSYKYKSGQEVAQSLYSKAQELIDSEFNTIADKNKFIRQIDLFKIHQYDSTARSCSLKDLEIAMRMDNVEEMPIPHQTWCKPGDEELILSYNKNDVEATYLFLKTTLGQTEYPVYKGKNKLKLRADIQNKFNINCLNLPDVRMGEQLLLNLYSRAIKKDPFEVKKLRTNLTSVDLKTCIPKWENVKSKEFKKFINKIKETTIPIPTPKDYFTCDIITHDYKWNFKLGGAHGNNKPGVYESNNEFVIVDFDIASLYPSIAKSLQLYPAHLGPEFIKLYSTFIDKRIEEKHKPKKERDNVLIEGYKLILNGTYGKSKEENSFLYDPYYGITTCISGEIFIAMWSERMIEVCPEIKFIQTNTDGQTILIPRHRLEAIRKVNEQLTKETSLIIEEVIYDKMFIRDVSNYIAIKEGFTPDKSEEDYIKLKGDYEINKEYYKDSSMKIVPMAVKNYFVYNIPIEDTIYNHTDILDFCLRLKTNSKSVGVFTHIKDCKIIKDKLGRTTRYYISKSGKAGKLSKQFNDERITGVNIGYNAIIFNKIERKPINEYQLDYNFYISEANKLKTAIYDGQLSLF